MAARCSRFLILIFIWTGAGYAVENDKSLSIEPFEIPRERLPEISIDTETFLYDRFISDVARIRHLRIIENGRMKAILDEMAAHQKLGTAKKFEIAAADWKGFVTVANFREFLAPTDLYDEKNPSASEKKTADLRTKVTIDLYFRVVSVQSGEIILAEKATGAAYTDSGKTEQTAPGQFTKKISAAARADLIKSALGDASDALSRRFAQTLSLRFGYELNADLAPRKPKRRSLGLALALVPGLGLMYADKPLAASTTMLLSGVGVGGYFMTKSSNSLAVVAGVVLLVTGGFAYVHSFVNTYTSISEWNSERGLVQNEIHDSQQAFALAFSKRF